MIFGRVGISGLIAIVLVLLMISDFTNLADARRPEACWYLTVAIITTTGGAANTLSIAD
jgi:hypothetical protein